tara:strand:+ start:545 stop:904 length:360 start_codon:yes stop_codon:yes gene_type:complete
MEKKRFGPKLKMNGLPKASKAKVLFHSLPKAVETTFDTGYGPDNNLKWEMDITLLEHPTQETLGKMVWQTTATVVRDELMYICNKQPNDKKLEGFLKDLESCEWNIVSDENGMISLEEI